MRKIGFILGLFVLSTITMLAQQKELNTKTSKIDWLGKKVTGEHSGHISFESGQLKFDGKKLASGEFKVDMNSITCTDISNEEYNANLVGHLKSDDFFGVDKHAYSTLKTTNVQSTSDGYKITANLTIKGKTNAVSFKATTKEDKLIGVIKIDRTLYDVRYGSGKFFDNLGDKMIDDIFELSFEIHYK